MFNVGESMANLTNTLNELRHMEFLEREVVYLDIQRLLAPVPPQRGDIRGMACPVCVGHP